MKDEIYLKYTADGGYEITVLYLKMGHYFEAMAEEIKPERMTEYFMKKIILVNDRELEDCNLLDLTEAMEAVNSQFVSLDNLLKNE